MMHVAAAAAVAAGGAAAGNELFAAKGHAAIAAVARLDPDFCFIDEHNSRWISGLGRGNDLHGCAAGLPGRSSSLSTPPSL